MLAAILIICGASVLTSCSKDNDNNTVLPSIEEMEAGLVGLWFDEFDYVGKTGGNR